MTDATTYVTAEGLEKLKIELHELITNERPRVAARIGEAKALGDISDNADYETAKNDQAFLEGRIATLEQQLRTAQVIDEDTHGKTVDVGSRVAFRAPDGEKLDFTIVGAFEAKPSDGRISNLSPIAQALLGHKAGDKITVRLPGGETADYELTKVS